MVQIVTAEMRSLFFHKLQLLTLSFIIKSLMVKKKRKMQRRMTKMMKGMKLRKQKKTTDRII